MTADVRVATFYELTDILSMVGPDRKECYGAGVLHFCCDLSCIYTDPHSVECCLQSISYTSNLK